MTDLDRDASICEAHLAAALRVEGWLWSPFDRCTKLK
jgi:hypothetical protein